MTVAPLYNHKPISLSWNISISQRNVTEKPMLGNIFDPMDNIIYSRIDIHDLISDICNLSDTNNGDDTKAMSKNITLKAVKIINGIYDYSLIGDLDYFANTHGTISLELERELDGREIYLHIEIGENTINWQFRVNGNRLDQEENIVYNLEDFCDITYSFPNEVKRGILLYKNNYQA